jgi:hypothetical protein
MTLTRYFGGLVRSQIEHLSEVLGQFVVPSIRSGEGESPWESPSPLPQRS